MSENATPDTSKLSRKEKLRRRFQEKMKAGELTEFTEAEPPTNKLGAKQLTDQVIELKTEPLKELLAEPATETNGTPTTLEPTTTPLDVEKFQLATHEVQQAIQRLLQIEEALGQTARDAIQLRTEYETLKNATFNDAIGYLDQVVEKKSQFAATLDSWAATLHDQQSRHKSNRRRALLETMAAAATGGLVSALLVLSLT